MNLIEQYILETPKVLKEILSNSKETFKEIESIEFDRLILTGSGTSYHSALQVTNYLQELLKIEVITLYPFQITENTFTGSHKELLIGISQGGSSYSTYKAMEVAKNNGAKIISMAGSNDAYIDEKADIVCTVRCGEEKAGAKTKGFYATKLNIMLFGLEYAISHSIIDNTFYNDEINKIEHSISQFNDTYKVSKKWVEENKETFATFSNLRFIGSSHMYGDVLESALKTLETLRIPVSGYEFEEFIHGIYNAIDEKSAIMIYDDGSEPRIDQLVKVLNEWTEHVYVISNQADKDASLTILTGREDMMTYNFIVPAQLMCAIVPPIKGIEPVTPKDPDFHRKLNSKNFRD